MSDLQTRAQAKLLMQEKGIGETEPWPSILEYVSNTYGHSFRYTNPETREFVLDETYRYWLLKGGEGGGKSAHGVIKNLDKLRRGMSGIMGSPDLEHFKKSLWPVFIEWCPWHRVIQRQRYRKEPGWEPSKTFTMVFKNELGGYSELICGGFKESEVGSWEGPNVNFVHFDEARRHKTERALKTLSGRVRIPGPNGEIPQMYFTTTPRKHWLYTYFGPLLKHKEDPKANFKRKAKVATVKTIENKRLHGSFAEDRADSLIHAEQREVLGGEWVDLLEDNKFIDIFRWNQCEEKIPPIRLDEILVVSLDGAKGGSTLNPDTFALNVVSRHPTLPEHTAVRKTIVWEIEPGTLFDFSPVRDAVRQICNDYNVLEVVYDPYQLHSFAMDLTNEGVAYFSEFKQSSAERYISDKLLQDHIMTKKIRHSGDETLTSHIDNAGFEKVGENKIKIVKRTSSLHVDAATSLSPAHSRVLYYIL